MMFEKVNKENLKKVVDFLETIPDNRFITRHMIGQPGDFSRYRTTGYLEPEFKACFIGHAIIIKDKEVGHHNTVDWVDIRDWLGMSYDEAFHISSFEFSPKKWEATRTETIDYLKTLL